MDDWDAPDAPHEVVICHYGGYARETNIETCQWHRDAQDPECKGCTAWKYPVRREG